MTSGYSRSIPAIACAALVALAAVAAAQESAPASRPLADAAALDRPVVEMPFEGEVPQWVFWKSLRDCAADLERRMLECGRDLRDSYHADPIHAQLEKVLRDACGTNAAFFGNGVRLDRIDLGRPRRFGALPCHFRSGVTPDLMREPLVDLRSPPVKLANADMIDIAAWELGRKIDRPAAIMCRRAPDLRTLSRLAADGFCACFIVNVEPADKTTRFEAHLDDIAGSDEGTLPIPVIYIAASAEPILAQCAATRGGVGELVIEAPAKDADRHATATVVTIAGRDRSRRAVLTLGATRRVHVLAPGSRSLEIAAGIEAARVLTAFIARKAAALPECDIAIVFPFDNDAGLEFLPHALGTAAVTVGVIDIANLAADAAEKPGVVLSFAEPETHSALSRALCGVAMRWQGKEGAWRYVQCAKLFEDSARPAALAAHQAALPLIRIGCALGSGGIESEAHALVRSNKSAPSKIVGISTSVDSYLDRLKNVADEKVTSAVGVTRLAILALLRLAHTRF